MDKEGVIFAMYTITNLILPISGFPMHTITYRILSALPGDTVTMVT